MNIHCKYDELKSPKELRPHPKNRNKHPEEQIERLAKIINYQGVRAPIVVSKKSGFIVKGHGTLLALKELAMKQVPVVYQDFEDEDQEWLFVQSDNAIASWAELDLSEINVDIQSLGPFDIDLLGIKDFEIEPADKYGDKDADATPAVRETSIRLGDLFQLGAHRLLCGDSTQEAQVALLMNGEKADMVFTDPPYGMNLDTDYSQMGNTTTKYKKVEGDAKPFDPAHIFSVPADEYWLWGADYYANRIPKYEEGSFTVWTKAHSDEENKVWTSRFELVWVYPKRKKEVWFVRSMQHLHGERTGEHPTQKPVELATRAFSVSKSEAKLIVDLYLGSGSTLIACEKTNRKCYGMEIDPQYCQVIIDRWEKFTGQKAVKL